MKEKIKIAAIAVVVVLFVLVVFQSIVIFRLQVAFDDSQKYIDYWRHKTDSMYNEYHNLYMRNLDLRDSISTLNVQVSN